MNLELYRGEMKRISQSNMIPWDKLRDKVVLVTGATGLIGKAVVCALLIAEEERQLGIKVYALVRNLEKAKSIFEDYETKALVIVEHEDIQKSLKLEDEIHYIIHGANPTESRYFVEHPVETSKAAFLGTMNMLDFAKEQHIDGFVFLSTMEVYGYPVKGHKVTEEEMGAFSTTKVRNCYPISKQMCENLCISYYKEYKVPTKILRLTQTFGVGVDYNDNRVFAEFARCAIEKRDIILKTKGLTERCYLDVTDAVSAILIVLLNGEFGQAYTAGNEDTYCSIYEMANLVADVYGIQVVVEEQDITKAGYADTLFMDLDVSKLKGLGWIPETNLIDTFKKLIKEMMGR